MKPQTMAAGIQEIQEETEIQSRNEVASDNRTAEPSTQEKENRKFRVMVEAKRRETLARRQEFERINTQYIVQRLEKVIEPMIINLLNEQPLDVKNGMKEWLMTQFNTTHKEREEFLKGYSYEGLRNWRENPRCLEKEEVLNKRHKLPRPAAPRQETREMEAGDPGQKRPAERG